MSERTDLIRKRIGIDIIEGKGFDNAGKPQRPAKCYHCGETQVLCQVTIAADLSHNGEQYETQKPVDACIADIIKALNAGAVKTRACCCGHGETNGNIMLMDGRSLVIRKER